MAIFAAAFTYLVDVSSSKNRTLRVTLLEVCYLASMPIGIALGNFIYRCVSLLCQNPLYQQFLRYFSKVDESYTIMFIINASLLAAAILYSMLRLQWRTTTTQRPVSEAGNLILDFFDLSHIVNTAKTITKRF